MRVFSSITRLALAFAMAHTLLLVPVAAQAQNNSKQAVEAARKHRAEQQGQGATSRSAPARSTGSTAAPPQERAYRSSANPNANPNAGLKSCMDHAGMNPLARDRCMRQHCEGRWGQGDCPASGGDFMANKGGSNTPLGQCLKDAGSNPFKRDACGWKHCNGKWDTSAECTAIKPRSAPLAQ